MFFTFLFIFLCLFSYISTECAEHSRCHTCTQDSSILGPCRWCPKSESCHAAGSAINPCASSENIIDPARCPPWSSKTLYNEEISTYMLKLSFCAYVSDPKLCTYIPTTAQIVKPYQYTLGVTTLSAYLGIDVFRKVIFFSFKGTDKGFTQLIEELLNIDGITTQIRGYSLPVTMNKYFLIGAGMLLNQAYNDYKDLTIQYPNYEYWFTGHSLGGAMAELVAFDLAGGGYFGSAHPLVYTFGAPRVGDINFVSQYASRVNNFRVVYNRDIVPHFKFQLWVLQTPIEIWYGGGDTTNGTPCLYEECESQANYDENAYCSNRFTLYNKVDHSTYEIVALLGGFCRSE